MIGESNVHGSGRLLNVLCKLPVGLAGVAVARWVIVYKNQLGSPLQQGLSQHGAHVGISAIYPSGANAHFVDHFASLV